MKHRSPDWTHWTEQSSLKAWECLSLSVGVEPRDLGVDDFLVLRSCETERPLLQDADPDWLRELCGRVPVLLDTLAQAPAGLRAGRSKPVNVDAPLKLAGFVAWARRKKLALPKPLRQAYPVNK